MAYNTTIGLIILGTASTSTCINISRLYPLIHYGAADTYLYSSIGVHCWQGAAKLPHDDNTYIGSYQNVFSQKVQSFAFTWGSASYCFHFQGPVQTCSICKRIVFLQGYLARGTFSRSRLARNWLLTVYFVVLAMRYGWYVLAVSSADLARN